MIRLCVGVRVRPHMDVHTAEWYAISDGERERLL